MSLNSPPAVVVLCSQQRRQLYVDVEGQFGKAIEWADDPMLVLRRALRIPPKAVVIDIPTGIRADQQIVSRLHDLRIGLPVLRSQVHADGTIHSMCVDPSRHDPLPTALDEILRGEPSWRSAWFHRKSVRVPYQRGLQWRRAGAERWERSYVLDISAGGLFMLAFDPAPPSSDLELSFPDDSPTGFSGRVAWCRPWRPDGGVPGMGVSLSRSVADALFGEALENASESLHWPPTTLATMRQTRASMLPR